MLGALLVLLGTSPLALGDPSCSNGQALVPKGISMSSKKKNRLGPDKCEDGNVDTVCTTKSEPYPTIILDFGQPVDIAQVKISANKQYPGLSEARVIVSNETVSTGLRAEGFEVERDSNIRARGRYLILQRDRSEGGNGGALSIAEVSAFCPKGPYTPGSPGGPWTDEEVLVVKEKVRFMVDFRNAINLYRDTEHFPEIVNEVYGNIWHPEDPSNKHWSNKSFDRSNMVLAPTTRKLIQLAFHDCLKNVDSEGNHFGGCDGCLNWEGMDDMNNVPAGNLGSTRPIWPSYRAQQIKYKTDNNKLSTTAMALELIYTDPTWPPGARELSSSLQNTGKSRADLWQLAANTGLEIEIAKANHGCTHKVSYQQMVVALEGKEKCLWKLQQPVPFQYGRADCVRDSHAATTDFPFEATNKESHSNPFGQGDWVLKDLKRDFGMPARQSIALMAVHAIAPAKHNTQLEVNYVWPGSPFISNGYFKTLGSRPQYNLLAGIRLGWGKSDAPLTGDEFGRPLTREVQGDFSITMRNWWNTSLPDSGPWFFRPLKPFTNKVDSSLVPRKACFQYNYTTEVYDRLTRDGCSEATINQDTGVQTGGPPRRKKRSHALSFYLPYEMGFVKNFTVDAENHPRGCNFPEVFPEMNWTASQGGLGQGDTNAVRKIARTPINCTRSTFVLEGESQTSADIVDEFADDHEVWAHAFIEGWQSIQKNGYGDSLNDGPRSSWLGYSLLPEGSPIEFPLLFTENPGFNITSYLAIDQATGCFEHGGSSC